MMVVDSIGPGIALDGGGGRVDVAGEGDRGENRHRIKLQTSLVHRAGGVYKTPPVHFISGMTFTPARQSIDIVVQ